MGKFALHAWFGSAAGHDRSLNTGAKREISLQSDADNAQDR
jgi:hypothetical protein